METKSWLIDNVQDDWVCIDAGANIGYHSILLAQLASRGLVYAFEPTRTYEMLLDNLEFNEIRNVYPLQLALGLKSGALTESIFRLWGKDPETRLFEFTTLDEFAKENELQRLDLIKIDVDGFDVDVLEGASSVLNTFSPIVVIELNHALATRKRSIFDAFECMMNLGYEEAVVLDRENYCFSKFSPRLPTSDAPKLTVRPPR